MLSLPLASLPKSEKPMQLAHPAKGGSSCSRSGRLADSLHQPQRIHIHHQVAAGNVRSLCVRQHAAQRRVESAP